MLQYRSVFSPAKLLQSLTKKSVEVQDLVTKKLVLLCLTGNHVQDGTSFICLGSHVSGQARLRFRHCSLTAQHDVAFDGRLFIQLCESSGAKLGTGRLGGDAESS